MRPSNYDRRLARNDLCFLKEVAVKGEHLKRQKLTRSQPIENEQGVDRQGNGLGGKR